MHRGDSGGDGMNALAVRSDPSYSYILLWDICLNGIIRRLWAGKPNCKTRGVHLLLRKSITKAILRRYLTQNQKLNRKWKLRRWHSVYVKDHTRGRAEKGIPSYKRKNREGYSILQEEEQRRTFLGLGVQARRNGGCQRNSWCSNLS
ncbi:unnamed protein product [Cochlearia groenlandica]